MKTTASRIERQLVLGEWKHCAVYEDELERFWPINQEEREVKIAQFAKEHAAAGQSSLLTLKRRG